MEAGHTHQAFAFADQALEERTDDVDLHRIAVVSGWMTGQTRAARSHLSRWDELIDADQEQRAELLHYKIRLLWESGDADADRAAEELAALADELPDSPARAQALADVAQHHMLVDRVRDAITVADRAVQVACDAGPEAASAQRQARVEGASARLAVASLREDAAIELSRLADEAERHGDYVTASRASGAGPMKLMFAVILPNAMPPIIVQSALMVGSAILFEAGLSFLGLTDPNVVSWGQIIGSNRQYILDAGYTVTIPGLAIFVTVLCISLVGDGLNDALNPKLRQR